MRCKTDVAERHCVSFNALCVCYQHSKVELAAPVDLHQAGLHSTVQNCKATNKSRVDDIVSMIVIKFAFNFC